jgi:hypothetical protein
MNEEEKIDGIHRDVSERSGSLYSFNFPVGFKGNSILEDVTEQHVEELKKKVADPECDPEKLNETEKQIVQDLLDGKDGKRCGYFYAPYIPLLTTPTVLPVEEDEDN